MLKVINDEEFKNKLVESINLLCNPVIKTLGPMGENVLISCSDKEPFITNDGVTIAKNIYSEDKIVNSILAILKEASLKTDEEVGDGTTTTLVLLKSLILNGLEKIKEGIEPLKIKKELDEYLNQILELLANEKIMPTKENYFDIASTSANDSEVGSFLAKIFLKTKDEKAIKIKESNNTKTYTEKINGYYFESGVARKIFLMNQNEIILNNCYILLLDYYLDDINSLNDIYNMMIENKTNLIILADSFSEEVIETTIDLNSNNDFKIILINSIDYVEKKKEVLEDLEIITNAKIVKYQNLPDINDLGFSKQVKCDLDKTIVMTTNAKNLKAHLKKLEKLALSIKEPFYLENIKERINNLKNKIIFIYVGGYTKTAKKELIMRYTDALCSLSSCQKGILHGSGLTLLKISEKIPDKMIKEVLESPIRQIMKNNNLSADKIIKEIKENNYQKLYNVKNNCFENIYDTKVLDAYLVVRKTLETAFSIAGMLLTTSSLVINEQENKNIMEI